MIERPTIATAAFNVPEGIAEKDQRKSHSLSYVRDLLKNNPKLQHTALEIEGHLRTAVQWQKPLVIGKLRYRPNEDGSVWIEEEISE